MQIDTSLSQYGDMYTENTTALIRQPKSKPLSASRILSAPKNIFHNVAVAATSSNNGCQVHLDMSSGNAGNALEYFIQLSNQGTEACDSTSFTMYYNENETFNSATIKPTASNYYWNFGTLTSGAKVTLGIKTDYTGDTTAFSSEACATANNGSDACVTSSFTTNVDRPISTVTPSATPTPSTTANPSTTPVMSPTQTPTPSISSSPSPAPIPYAQQNKEFGTWVWTTPDQLSTQDMQNIVMNAAVNNFNLIYLTIDSYLSIDNMSDGTAKEQKKSAYMDSLAQFVSIANTRGIAVDAEAGWRDWSETSGRSKSYAILNFVEAYNQARPNQKVRGLQYDVEPYLLPAYSNANKQAGILTNFVQWVDQITTMSQNKSFTLSFVIPHFYDAQQKWTPQVTFNGKKDYTFNHMVSIMNRLPSSNILIMAYRDFALGNNGTIQISQKEIADAEGSNIHIIVAQETGNVDPDYVTFYGQSKNELYTEIDKVNNAFAGNQSFGGIAIHYLDPFLALNN
jgi:hypothetical protein